MFISNDKRHCRAQRPVSIHWFMLGSFLSLSCASRGAVEAPKPSAAVASSPPKRAVVSALAPSTRRAFARQGVSLDLPVSFTAMVESGSWSHMDTGAGEQQVWVLHQVARRTVTVAECEQSARMSLSLLRHEGEVIDERAWLSPDGYAGTLRVVVLEQGGALVEGFSVALSRCLSVVYVVHAREVADGLRTFVQEVYPHVELLRAGEGQQTRDPLRF